MSPVPWRKTRSILVAVALFALVLTVFLQAVQIRRLEGMVQLERAQLHAELARSQRQAQFVSQAQNQFLQPGLSGPPAYRSESPADAAPAPERDESKPAELDPTGADQAPTPPA